MLVNDATLNSTTAEDLRGVVVERVVHRQTHFRPSRLRRVESQVTLFRSSHATQRNDRQVLSLLDMIDNQPQLYTTLCSKLPRRAASEGAAKREPSARFEARPVPRGSQAIEDFARRPPAEPLVN